jgi:hypothetical protein
MQEALKCLKILDCFKNMKSINFSLLGFGDYCTGIPAIQANKTTTAAFNLLIGFIYFFIGMALLAMCFALMQDEMKEKMSLIVTKLGIKGDDEEEEEEEEIEDEKANPDEKDKKKASKDDDDDIEKPVYANAAYEHDVPDSANSRTRSPPHYDNSALDLRFEKEATVISVKPTLETYAHDDVQETSKEKGTNLTAFKREATNLQQKKKELEREMSNVQPAKGLNYAFGEADSDSDDEKKKNVSKMFQAGNK